MSRKITWVMLLPVTAALTLSLQACNETTSIQTAHEHAQDHQHENHGGKPHRHGHDGKAHEHHVQAVEEFITLRNHQFKLVPEIGSNQITHLDLYVQNADHTPVSGAKILLHLTGPDARKQTFSLAEGENHYHTQTRLTQTGVYQAVAQVDIDGEKFNPRFQFNPEN